MELKSEYSNWLASSSLFKDELTSQIPLFDRNTNSENNTNVELSFPKQLMLGKRVERFFSKWINNSERFKLIGENIQLIEEGVTKGEIDFLLEDTLKEEKLHVELVFKIYLFDHEGDGDFQENWIGPNRNDTLSMKLKKLRDHQFPILKSGIGIKTLAKLSIDAKELKQKLCFNGWLFTHPSQEQNTNILNPKAWAGFWIYRKELKTLDESYWFSIPPKWKWLDNEVPDEEWMNYQEAKITIDKFLNSKKSPMVWIKNGESQTRGFIVWW